MPIPRPHVGPLVHRLLTTPIRPDLFSRHRYTGPPASDELQLTWLGTAGFRLEYRGQVLLIDPYVSRPGMRASLLRPLRPDHEAIRRHVPDADVIVCTHSHHDHILDVPDIARLTGAQVIGSSSTCNLCRGAGLSSNQLVEVDAPQALERGPFRITLRRSLHGRALFNRVPLEGSIPPGTRPPLRLNEFRNDTNFGVLIECLPEHGDAPGLQVFHLGSADFYPETVDGLHADVLLACLAGRHRREGYVRELLLSLQPRVVIPCHYDDFFRPLEEPIRELPKTDLAGFREEVLRTSVSTRLVILDLLGSFRCRVDDPALPPRPWES